MGLNPFENQVYFHSLPCPQTAQSALCLNPFENQVYFHPAPPTRYASVGWTVS